MNDILHRLDDFAITSKRRKMTDQQMTKAVKGSVARLSNGLDILEEQPDLATEPDPVRWGEAMLFNRDGSPQRYWDHQKEALRNPARKQVKQSARDTGKTTVLATKALHWAFTRPRRIVLIATPQRSHYAKIIAKIEGYQSLNPSLDARTEWFTDKAGGTELRFANGSRILFRHTNPHGTAVRGEDADMVVADESAWICKNGWDALEGCLRADGDGIMDVFSNPNGLRSTPYYRFTTQDKTFVVQRWPRTLNPFFTEQMDAELVVYHGGKDTPGYQHEVLGVHGEPLFSVFKEADILAALQPHPSYTLRRISGADIPDISSSSETELRTRLRDLLALPRRRGVFYLGGDLGLSRDPSDFTIAEETPDGRLILEGRIHCENLPYPLQAEVVALLDEAYAFTSIGLDAGNNGMGMYQDLTTLDKFKVHNFASRLKPFSFGTSVVVGYEVDEHGQEDESKPLKRFVKVHATDLMNLALSQKQLVLYDEDLEMQDQLSGHTYRLSGEHRITYTKGNDHIVDSLRCLFMARWDHAGGVAEVGSAEEMGVPVMLVSNRGF